MWRFSIQIIDEADRMIDSMHQLWLSQVVKAVFKSGSEPDARRTSIFRRTEPTHVTAARYSRALQLERILPHRRCTVVTTVAFSSAQHYCCKRAETAKQATTLVFVCSLSPPQMPLQKLLFSATLTQNPEKLQQLGLHQPRLFSSVSGAAAPALSQDRFDFPEGLTVRTDQQVSGSETGFVEVRRSGQPCGFILVFRSITSPARWAKSRCSSSTSSCTWSSAPSSVSPTPGRRRTGWRTRHQWKLFFSCTKQTNWSFIPHLSFRLLLLVQLFGGVQAAEFSSRLSPGERKRTLKEFEQGKIQLWVERSCSWKWCLETSKKNKNSPLLSEMKLPVLYLNLILLWFLMNCASWAIVSKELDWLFALKVDLHRCSSQGHRRCWGEERGELWCTTVHQDVHPQVGESLFTAK